jgi:hypothetical protein
MEWNVLMTILLLAAVALVIIAITGSIVLAVTDGFRRIPARRA